MFCEYFIADKKLWICVKAIGAVSSEANSSHAKIIKIRCETLAGIASFPTGVIEGSS